jgi:hypothetical protein
MKITVNEQNTIQLEKVFNEICLKTKSGETMWIVMRDTGFEFNYQNKLYSAKNGAIKQINLIDRI